MFVINLINIVWLWLIIIIILIIIILLLILNTFLSFHHINFRLISFLLFNFFLILINTLAITSISLYNIIIHILIKNNIFIILIKFPQNTNFTRLLFFKIKPLLNPLFNLFIIFIQSLSSNSQILSSLIQIQFHLYPHIQNPIFQIISPFPYIFLSKPNTSLLLSLHRLNQSQLLKKFLPNLIFFLFHHLLITNLLLLGRGGGSSSVVGGVLAFILIIPACFPLIFTFSNFLFLFSFWLVILLLNFSKFDF